MSVLGKKKNKWKKKWIQNLSPAEIVYVTKSSECLYVSFQYLVTGKPYVAFGKSNIVQMVKLYLPFSNLTQGKVAHLCLSGN